MKKIITLFKRNYESDCLVRDEIAEGAEWVIRGEGIATRKWDGKCCMCRDGNLYKRRELNGGEKEPHGFEPENDFAPKRGKRIGWVPIGLGIKDEPYREAYRGEKDGTYELVGPKINGNPEGIFRHILIPHGKELLDAPRTFNELKEWLPKQAIEGVVWHHPDGRMVKIKLKDFGFKRISIEELKKRRNSLKVKA